MAAWRPACGGGGGAAVIRGGVTRAAVPLLLLLFLPLLAPGGGGADAARTLKARTCSMRNCAVCEMHPAPYRKSGNRRPGMVRQCMRPASGYAAAADRRSVPSECMWGRTACVRGKG